MKLSIPDALRMIEEEATKEGVDPEFVKKLFGRENFKDGIIPATGEVLTNRVSNKQAKGLMQFVPATWQSLVNSGRLPADADPLDPKMSIKASVQLSKELLARYKGNQAAAAADYNGGPQQGIPVSQGKAPPAAETQEYIKSFTSTGATPVATPSGKVSVGSSSSISVRKNDIDEEAYGNEVDRFIAKNAELLSQMAAAMGVKAGIHSGISTAAVEHGKQVGKEAVEQGEIDAKRNLQSRSILDAFQAGHSPDSAIIQERARVEILRKQMGGLKEEIDARDAVSVLDNPVQWLLNQFQVPTLKSKYNAMVDTETAAMARVEQTQRQVEAQMRIDAPSIAENIRQKAAAQAAAAAAQAQVTALQAQQATAADSIKLLEHSMHVNGADSNARLGMYKVLAEQYRFSEASNAQTKQDKEIGDVLEPVNAWRVKHGLKPYTIGQFKLLDSKQRSEIMQDSMRTLDGTSPGDALERLVREGAIANLQTTNPAQARFLGQQLNQEAVKETEKQLRMDPKLMSASPDVIKAKALDLVVKQQQEELAKKRNHDKLPAGHFARVSWEDATLQEATKDHPIAGSIREAMATKQQGSPVEMKDLAIVWVGKGMADPKAIPTLARDISNFIRTTQLDQWARQGASLGYPRPTEFVFDQLDGKEKVNAWSPASIERWLVYNVIAAKAAPGFQDRLYENWLTRFPTENKQ